MSYDVTTGCVAMYTGVYWGIGFHGGWLVMSNDVTLQADHGFSIHRQLGLLRHSWQVYSVVCMSSWWDTFQALSLNLAHPPICDPSW